MTATDGNRAGKLLPVGLLAMGLALLGSFVAVPLMQIQRLDADIAFSQPLLDGLHAQIARQPGIAGPDGGPAGANLEARLLLQGQTTGIAGANMQKLINDLVVDFKGTASSFQILPPKEDGDLTRIAMSLSISIDIDGLRNILYKIETGTPFIFIDDIAVRVPQTDAQDANPHYLGPFDVTMQVSGFVLKDEAL